MAGAANAAVAEGRIRHRAVRLFGPYLPIAFLFAVGLALLSLSRVGLAIWQADRIEATGLPLSTFFLQGVRADAIQMAIFCAPLALLSVVLATKRTWRIWTALSYVWVVASVMTLVFMEVSTPSFIAQYDFRPNRLFIEYLAYPREVFSTVWTEFRGAFIAGIAMTAFVSFVCGCAFRFWLAAPREWSGLKRLSVFPVVIVLLFAAMRSTADHRPANPALFALTGDPLVNSLIINSSWSVVHAIYNLKHESKSSDVYGKIDVETMLKANGLWTDAGTAGSSNPLLRFHQASVSRERPLNLVIVLEESLGATFVGSLGGKGVTPEIERLKSGGWWFENLYATGTRSVRGIEAVVSGFLPTPSRSVVKLSLSQSGFFTIASLLESQGYFTEFVYGGEAHFDNMRAFFTGNGFQSVIDQNDYANPIFHGTWGVCDEDLFNKADERFLEMHEAGKPFFSLVFTTSNHSPFEYPEGRIELHDPNPATENNAVKYADYALGRFIDKAKTQPYWKDTLFLIVADHDIRVHGDELVPIKHFQIPGLILGADIAPKTIQSVVSQIDLPTTMLSLMGINAAHPMIGRDLTREDAGVPGRAMMQFASNFCLMEGNDAVILQPEKPPVFGVYDREAKAFAIVGSGDSDFSTKALATSHLPSWLYRNQLYKNAPSSPLLSLAE